MDIPMQKVQDIDALFSKILTIKESCDLIGVFWANLRSRIFPDIGFSQNTQKIVGCFILGYCQEKKRTFYEKSRKLFISGPFRAQKNPLFFHPSISRFLALSKTEKTNEQIPTKTG